MIISVTDLGNQRGTGMENMWKWRCKGSKQVEVEETDLRIMCVIQFKRP